MMVKKKHNVFGFPYIYCILRYSLGDGHLDFFNI